MPAKHAEFKVEFEPTRGVPRVAYVSSEGWNDHGYGVSYSVMAETRQAATSWGTASRDLQAVINSWTGGNFDEIWVHGTVAPKSWAACTGTYSDYKITPTGDDRDKAFVIPPGLKIYGGFTGKEEHISSGGGSTNRFPGSISAGHDQRKKTKEPGENGDGEWRMRSVLSGAITATGKTYHVVILADIPNDYATVLDGLTVSGGLGASSEGSITVKGSQIDKQSGAGLYLVNASPVLQDLRIQENRARKNGGGIYNLAAGGTSSPKLTGKTEIYDNSVVGNGHGGGMYNRANTANSTCAPEVSGVIFELNQTGGNGGGMANEAVDNATAVCRPVITGGTVFRANAATNGGGVSNGQYTSTFFDGALMEANTAGNHGGGVYNATFSSPSITNTVITGNTANAYGGGITAAGDSRVEITNVTISGNKGSAGAGVFISSPTKVIMTNILIENNTVVSTVNAPYRGGGIFVENYFPQANLSTVLFINNGIIRNNSTPSNGGGISVLYTGSRSTNSVMYVALTNVLIAGNTANQAGGIEFSNETNVTGSDAGYGIRARLTNVTIAGNNATSNVISDIAHGILTKASNPTANNPAVFVYNSVIWGNNIIDANGRNTYYNSLAEGLTLGGSGASTGYTSANGNFNPGLWSSSPPLDGSYKLGAHAGALVNGGSNNHYDYLSSKTIGGVTNINAILTEAAGGTITWANPGNLDTKLGTSATTYLSRDATAAPSGTGSDRKQGGAIDVGAYENQ
jgi:hypothetical protein